MTKRGPQVMRYRIAERFQFLIGGLEQLSPALQLRGHASSLGDIVMDQKVYRSQENQLHECTEPEQGDCISRASSGLRHSHDERSSFGRIEFRHQAMDSFELIFCRARKRKVADALIAMLFTLGNGSCLCSQLPGNEPFECLHPGLLFRFLVRQASEIL